MYCDKCGANNSGANKYCTVCGALLTGTSEIEQPVEERPVPKQNNPKLILIAAVLCCIAVIIPVVNLFGGLSGRNNSGQVIADTSVAVVEEVPLEEGIAVEEIAEETDEVIEIQEEDAEPGEDTGAVDAAETENDTEPIEDTGTEDEVETGDNTEPEEEAPRQGSTAAFGTLADIKSVCTTPATCETQLYLCVVDVHSDVNPYDVVYDYGRKYNIYVEACDWSLVFDAEYYKETFPILAIQYHNDDDLLLMHFQTVGVHEGRQGSADFNVGAYMSNCDTELYNTFEANYACYYIYYMLNYSTEKNVNTVTNESDSTPLRLQYDIVLNAFQKAELRGVNAYREKVGAEPLLIDSEMNAYAMYRAYTNSHDGWSAHDWAKQNDAQLWQDMRNILATYAGNGRYSENNVEGNNIYGVSYSDNVEAYARSPEHYEAMINTEFSYTGMSCKFWNTETGAYNQFDLFTNDYIDSAMYPYPHE